MPTRLRWLLLVPILLPSVNVFAATVGDDAKTFTAQLADPDTSKVQAALEGLKKLGAGGVGGLLEASKHDQAWVRATAWHWLGDIGADAKPALEPLCAALAGPPRDEWASTGELAFGLGTHAAMLDAMPKGKPLDIPGNKSVEEREEIERMAVRVAAMSALKKIGATDLSAFVASIAKAEMPLDRGYCDLHACFAAAATEAKEKGREVVLAGLAHASARVQVASLVACCLMAKTATELGGSIAKSLASPDAGVRGLAAEALVRVKHPCDGVRERLLELTRDDSVYVRVQAARASAVACAGGEAVLPVLETCMADKSTFARMAAINTLERLAGGTAYDGAPASAELRPESAVKSLITALADASAAVREAAASALGSYGPVAESALPALREAVKDTNSRVRSEAKRAIKKVEKR